MSTSRSTRFAATLYRFGPYEVDTARSELRKFGIRVRLERKPFQLLVALLERAGTVVTRSDLQHSLWGDDLFVDFAKGLGVAVAKVRAALNDSSESPTYIETVAGEGYRFMAKVEQVFAPSFPTSDAADGGQATAPLLPQVPDQVQFPLSAVHPRQSGLWNRRGFSAAVLVVGVALLVVGGTTLIWRRPLAPPEAVPAGRIMLVVLPFENLTGDPAQEYLSDGMTEELNQRLGNLSPQRLGVIGRTSAMTYKQSRRSISQIGKELAVGYVLEGSVRRQGNNLRVTAQLVKVSDQAHVWARAYSRDVRDLLQVEDDIASDIARQVGVTIAVGPPTKPTHTPNPEAHEAYLLARYHWHKRTPAGWATAALYFRRATAIDPSYAAAYSGLATCRIAKQEALAAARKAVELDPTSGEARWSLGWVELYRNLDLAAAESALRSAVQLDPNYAYGHHTYSALLEMTGRFREAIHEQKQAVLLDPLSRISRASLAGQLSRAGQHDASVEQLKLLFAMDPQYPKAHEVLGTIDLRRGMYKEAIREYQLSEKYGGAKLLGPVGYAYARSGNKLAATKILSQLQEQEKRSTSGKATSDASGDIVMVEIGLGHRDEAIARLQKIYQQHDDDLLLFLKIDPTFDPLRSDPRFQDLLRRMNVPS